MRAVTAPNKWTSDARNAQERGSAARAGRRSAFSFLAAAAACLAIGAGALSAQAQDFPRMTLRSAQSFPSVGIASEAHRWWADEIAKRTNGRVTIQIFWGGSLVAARDIPAAVASGAVHIGHVPSTYDPARTRLWMTLDLPFNVRDHWCAVDAGRRVSLENEHLTAEFKRNNLVPVVGYSSGFQQFLTKDAVRATAALRGRRMRSYGGARVPFLEALGITPVFMPFSEIYEALDRGVLDGSADVAVYLIPSFKLHEVAKQLLVADSGAAVAAPLAVMNRDTWDKLPPELQKVFLEVGREHDMRYARALIEIERKFLEDAQSKYGMTVHRLGADDRAKMEEAAHNVRERWLDEAQAASLAARNVWDHFQRLQKECEAEVAAKGHPWGQR